jgi:hypothetical protein
MLILLQSNSVKSFGCVFNFSVYWTYAYKAVSANGGED